MKASNAINMIWLAILLAFVYWFLEPAIYAFVLQKGTFTDKWLHPEAEELRTRMSVVSLLLLFGVYAQTMLKRQQQIMESLQASKQKIRQIIDTANDAFITIDPAGTISDWNPMAEMIFGWPEDLAIGKNMMDLIMNQAPRNALIDDIQEFINTGSAPFTQGQIVITALHRDGHEFPAEMSISPQAVGASFIFNIFVRDISQRKADEEKLETLATRDELTGLINRFSYNHLLKKEVALAKRHMESLAVLFLDLDGFKNINDSLGHDVGDQLLRETADRLSACIRESDTVARIGGDEFLIIMPGIKDVHDPRFLCERILNMIGQPYHIGNQECFVGASIGISLYPLDGDNVESLVKNADTAMYQAKDSGRNAYKFFTPAMGEEAFKRMEMERALRYAIEKNQFKLLYQPQVELSSGRILGVEALLRWTHPEWGPISPSVFISLIENTNLILPIGEWVLDEACKQNKAWQALHPGFPLRMAVNFAARQFAQADLVETVAKSLQKSGLAAEFLELEITEGSAMNDIEVNIRKMQALKELGVSIAIDDFGTGFSSLAYLKRFPIDILKIDKSFLDEIQHGKKDAAIVATISEMAHSLGMEVIAEGVETKYQLEFLRGHGCDMIQGYLFSRPVPPEQIAEILQNGGKIKV
ncbi:putative bifunctional diguanylate cyclase/phosphodiesterase [Mariprofundus ferrooxydans]|uniref:putative bifunctional diguanylate cyclase/phosphodiesterase n=1 Tax=Mariprofundus ferrooxydans TaxID=314344 RepID=UPI00037C2EA7|nr:EAL domain-containing protein [Mariprofundus ferrooxydans]